MFGRRTKPTTAEPPSAVTTRPGAKGRPTPTRREAEAARRKRVKPVVDRREATRQARAQARARRTEAREGLLSGDERRLPPRDQGPVRRHVRDLVDSRRSVAEFFLYIAFGVLLLTFVRIPSVQAVGTLLWLVAVVGIALDSVLLARKVKRRLRERFPDESHRGAVPYALMRSLQIRRLRLPRPKVKPGTKV